MRKLTRMAAVAAGIAAAGASTVLIGAGSAQAAVPNGCIESRQLTSVTVTCPGTTNWYAPIDVDCVGVYLTYGLGPGAGPYTQLYFGNLSQGVTGTCVGGYPNTGLGIVTGVRVR